MVDDSGRLPGPLQLTSITNLKFVRAGAEASVWLGQHQGRVVTELQINHPTTGEEWDSEEGRQIIRVRQFLRSCI